MGANSVLEIPFTASPKPTVDWKFKNGKMPDSRRFKEDTNHKKTSMSMSKVVRSDTGTYTCEIENEHGSTKATIKVLVIGKKFSMLHLQLMKYNKVRKWFH